MDLKLKGKRALVTGSSSGIGESIARMLAGEGCEVIVHGRDRERALAVAEGIGAACTLGDLGDEAMAYAVAEAAGPVDILVNNAGGTSGTSSMTWTTVSDDAWRETFAKNVQAAARLTRRLLPRMQASGWGRIINIASTAGSSPIPIGPDYGAAKAAMLNMTVSLSRAVAATGVTVNSISPGPVMTPAARRFGEALAKDRGWDASSFDLIERRMVEEVTPVPVGHYGRPEDIAYVVCMVASPSSGYMTGANIRVDGGQLPFVN